MTGTLSTLEMQQAQAACEKCFTHTPSQVSQLLHFHRDLTHVGLVQEALGELWSLLYYFLGSYELTLISAALLCAKEIALHYWQEENA